MASKKENTTKSFVLRVDAATMDAIEKWAADEFRSTNGQLQWIINEALRKSGRLKKSNRKPKEEKEETNDD
ncbi:DNA-binding protein [uncultured Bacteroides sp.]|uniref:DNA-binding protein n=1 Tax=uncultured Bacteroides sp. TaxID=162156 RepID=UPI0025936DDB|nr:DNA-binding protein [uncultured Bacteroides sp.]